MSNYFDIQYNYIQILNGCQELQDHSPRRQHLLKKIIKTAEGGISGVKGDSPLCGEMSA
jgi:hypothetical protein